jgi:GT2 family glycosyltransferase
MRQVLQEVYSQAMIRTSIVLINYFKEEELAAFVDNELAPALTDERLLMIVDNGSSSNLLIEKFGPHPRIDILEPKKNLGYFGAARLAYEHLQAKQIAFDNFIISNFDLEFKSNNFFYHLERVCQENEAAVIGPSITSSLSGAALNPMYAERLPINKLNRLLFVTSFHPFHLCYQWMHHVKRKLSGSTSVEQSPAYVYTIHGSFMILKKAFFEAGGNLNFQSFLYGEELFIAEQCRKKGLKTWFEPSLKVEHREHSTTGNYKDARHMKFLHRSLRYIRDEYYAS